MIKMNIRKSLLEAAIITIATGYSISAKAAFIYDFSAGSFGEIKFNTNNLITSNTGPIQITSFILGSLAPPNFTATQTSNYIFGDAISSLGVKATYQFNFNSLPFAVGTFTPFQTVVDRTPVNGSLTITQQAAIPEPATMAVFGSAIAGLAVLRNRKRRLPVD